MVVAVEAKGRQRTMKVPFDIASIRPGVKQLLMNAAEKTPAHTLIACLEMNLPPAPTDQPPSWVPHLDAVVKDIVQDAGGQWPFERSDGSLKRYFPAPLTRLSRIPVEEFLLGPCQNPIQGRCRALALLISVGYPNAESKIMISTATIAIKVPA